MGKGEVIRKLREYKRLLLRHCDLYKLVLYGSYAHGTPKEYSDIDVAVIVNKIEGEYFDYAPKLWTLRRDIDSRIEPKLFIRGKDENGFLEHILRTGIEI